MGAYTSATATDFNLFKRAKIVVINQKPAGKETENTVAFI
jgi:hypothetical protein